MEKAVISVNETVKRVEHKLIMTFLDATYREKQIEDHKQIAAGVGEAIHDMGMAVGQLRDHPDEVVLTKAAEVIQAYNNAGGGVVGLGRGLNRINPLFLGADALSKSTVEMVAAAQRGDPRSFGKNATPLAIFLGTSNLGTSSTGPSSAVAVPVGGPLPAIPVPKVASLGNAVPLEASGILLVQNHSPERKKLRRERDAAQPFLSPNEFEAKAHAKFGGVRNQRLPLSKPRPSGIKDADIDLVSESTLTQVKRAVSPDAIFGPEMQEQFRMTVDAAQVNGRKNIRYVVASETPQSFVDQIRAMPVPKGLSLVIERLPARR